MSRADASDIDKVQAAQREHTREISSLRHRVDQLGVGHQNHEDAAASLFRLYRSQKEAIDALRDAVRAFAEAPEPAAAGEDHEEIPCWLTLTDEGKARELITGLPAWVDEVYMPYLVFEDRSQTEDADRLADCWLWHPAVIAELLVLRETHRAAHEGPRASWQAVADWHDRYRPGAARRITAMMGRCRMDRHKQPGYGYRPQRTYDDVQVDEVVTWWASSRQTLPVPTPRPDTLAASEGRRSEREDRARR